MVYVDSLTAEILVGEPEVVLVAGCTGAEVILMSFFLRAHGKKVSEFSWVRQARKPEQLTYIDSPVGNAAQKESQFPIELWRGHIQPVDCVSQFGTSTNGDSESSASCRVFDLQGQAKKPVIGWR